MFIIQRKQINSNTIQEDLNMKFNTKHNGVFAAGVLFGTAGIKFRQMQKTFTQKHSRSMKIVQQQKNLKILQRKL